MFVFTGAPITVKGVNRHEHTAEGGKAVSWESMVSDSTHRIRIGLTPDDQKGNLDHSAHTSIYNMHIICVYAYMSMCTYTQLARITETEEKGVDSVRYVRYNT